MTIPSSLLSHCIRRDDVSFFYSLLLSILLAQFVRFCTRINCLFAYCIVVDLFSLATRLKCARRGLTCRRRKWYASKVRRILTRTHFLHGNVGTFEIWHPARPRDSPNFCDSVVAAAPSIRTVTPRVGALYRSVVVPLPSFLSKPLATLKAPISFAALRRSARWCEFVGSM